MNCILYPFWVFNPKTVALEAVQFPTRLLLAHAQRIRLKLHQQIAAGVMWVPGSITFVIVIFVYLHRWLAPAPLRTGTSRLAGEL